MKDLEIQGGQLNYLFTEKCYNLCISFLGYKTCPVILSITRFVASSLHTHKKKCLMESGGLIKSLKRADRFHIPGRS